MGLFYSYDEAQNIGPPFLLGDIFSIHFYNDMYILCQVEAQYFCLVSIKDGNRFRDPVTIGKVTNFTWKDIYTMAGTQNVRFVGRNLTMRNYED